MLLQRKTSHPIFILFTLLSFYFFLFFVNTHHFSIFLLVTIRYIVNYSLVSVSETLTQDSPTLTNHL